MENTKVRPGGTLYKINLKNNGLDFIFKTMFGFNINGDKKSEEEIDGILLKVILIVEFFMDHGLQYME